MATHLQTSQALEKAAATRTPVRFTRRYEDFFLEGFVLRVTRDWFLMALLRDGGYLDGYKCLRVADVRNLRVPPPNGTFILKAMKELGHEIPTPPAVQLGDIQHILKSARKLWPLVTIYTERSHPDCCQIGQVLKVERSRVWLQEINPDATWDAEPTSYVLSTITQVAFGGDYERALALVAEDLES